MLYHIALAFFFLGGGSLSASALSHCHNYIWPASFTLNFRISCLLRRHQQKQNKTKEKPHNNCLDCLVSPSVTFLLTISFFTFLETQMDMHKLYGNHALGLSILYIGQLVGVVAVESWKVHMNLSRISSFTKGRSLFVPILGC